MTEQNISATYNDGSGKLDFIASGPTPEMPETIEINGVTYVRQMNGYDELASQIEAYQAIATRTGLEFRQVAWFAVFINATNHRLDIDASMPD